MWRSGVIESECLPLMSYSDIHTCTVVGVRVKMNVLSGLPCICMCLYPLICGR